MARRIKFTRSQMQQAKRLLHMKYKPSEIAEEIGCSVEFIRRTCIPAGCPHERQKNGRYWIVGDQFKDWMFAQRREKGSRLKEGQGYCVICEKGVDIQGPLTVKQVTIHLELVQGYCAECGAVVSRGQAKGS